MADFKYYYIACYKYTPVANDEIPMEEGDIMEVNPPLSDTEDPENPQGWLYGCNKTLHLYGLFPGNYVRAFDPDQQQYEAETIENQHAAGSMALDGAQDIVTCESCTSFVRHFCLTCSSRLCDNCRTFHNTTHHVVPFTEKFSKDSEMCKEHKNVISLYCKTCQDFVCLRCLIRKHNGHNIVEIEEMYEKELLKFKTKTDIIERRAVHGTMLSLNQSRKHFSDLKETISQIRSTMKKETAAAKMFLDSCLKKELQELDKIDSEWSHLLVQQESTIRNHLMTLETEIANRKSILESKLKIEFLKDAKNDDKQSMDELKIPESIPPLLPRFTGYIGETKHLFQEIFGSLQFTKDFPTTESLIQYVDAPPAKHWKPPIVIKTLDLEGCVNVEELAKMSPPNKANIWIADQRRTAVRISKNGEIQQRLTFSKLEERLYSDIICLKGFMVYCCYDRNSEPIISCPERQISWHLDSNECPCCMCLYDDIIVVLVTVGVFDKYKLKFCFENGTCKKEKVVLDKNLQSLLRKNKSYPDFMVHNAVGENIVISHTLGAVVVGSSLHGECKFEYHGKQPGINTFKPAGLASDRYGHILIADVNNACIHMLQHNGDFLTFIATSDHGLCTPFPLSIDHNGLLWIGQYRKKVVIVIDYLL